MNKEYEYKTCDFIYIDNKDKIKKYLNNEYGYNFDSSKRISNNISYDKTKTYINKEYLDNHKY